jgi:tRNA threonylcarbamoyladenosine biosynthesis protein TsaE
MLNLTPDPSPARRGKEFISTSADETRHLAARLGGQLTSGDCVLLIGELGAGKTTFVQGLAQGLGITETVRSPTFILMREYHGRITLYHFDAYRIKNLDELREIGFEDTVRAQGITVIEWGERAKGLLPEGCWYIEIELLPDQTRRICIERPKIF